MSDFEWTVVVLLFILVIIGIRIAFDISGVNAKLLKVLVVSREGVRLVDRAGSYANESNTHIVSQSHTLDDIRRIVQTTAATQPTKD